MGYPHFASIGRKRGGQLIFEAIGNTDGRDIECLGEVMSGEIDLYIRLLHLDIGDDALQIR